MPLALVALLASAPAAALVHAAHHTSIVSATVTRCSWDKPGDKPFMGDVVAAVDRYRDIPTAVRARLQARMAGLAYDEIVRIGRDTISGSAQYRPEIRDMHFGAGRVCASVNRTQWARNAQERGLVYCEASHCILVPTVCRNVSRITRTGTGAAPDGGLAAAGGGGGNGSKPDAAPAGLAGAPGLAERADSNPAAAGGAPVDGLSDWPLAALPAGQISANTTSADPAGALATAIAPVGGLPAALVAGAGAGAGLAGGGAVGAAGGVAGARNGYAGGSVALGQRGLIDAPTPAVPEPGNGLLLLSGLLALGGWAHRRAGRPGRTSRPGHASPSVQSAQSAQSVQRDLGAHRAGAVSAGGQGDAGAAFGDHHPLGHRPVSGDLAVGQKRLQ